MLVDRLPHESCNCPAQSPDIQNYLSYLRLFKFVIFFRIFFSSQFSDGPIALSDNMRHG